jgi:hypothetical protein
MGQTISGIIRLSSLFLSICHFRCSGNYAEIRVKLLGRKRLGVGHVGQAIVDTAMKRQAERRLMKAQDVANALLVSRRLVENMRRAKIIPAVTISGNRIRFEWEAVLAALRERNITED